MIIIDYLYVRRSLSGSGTSGSVTVMDGRMPPDGPQKLLWDDHRVAVTDDPVHRDPATDQAAATPRGTPDRGLPSADPG